MELSGTERLIRRDRAIVAGGLLLIGLLSWVWVLRGAGMGMTALDMTRWGLFPHAGPPPGPMSMSPPFLSGILPQFVLMASMWWIMMIAMMLPSAAPMMLLHARTVRHAQRRGRMPDGPVATGLFLSGYLVVWLGFSLAATLLQTALVRAGALSPMMLWSVSPWLSTSVLALAAVWQVTPARAVCLEHCRSPAHWLSRHWRPGPAGAFRMGLAHGAYCVGCCWALMLLLFVGGVMNLIWIAALGGFVLLEKLGVFGARSSYVSAALLALWAVATLVVG